MNILLLTAILAQGSTSERLVRLEEGRSQTLLDMAAVNKSLETINGKLDKLLAQAAVSEGHEERIRNLEAFRWQAMGFAVALQTLTAAGMITILKRKPKKEQSDE